MCQARIVYELLTLVVMPSKPQVRLQISNTDLAVLVHLSARKPALSHAGLRASGETVSDSEVATKGSPIT